MLHEKFIDALTRYTQAQEGLARIGRLCKESNIDITLRESASRMTVSLDEIVDYLERQKLEIVSIKQIVDLNFDPVD